ncbi:DUF1613-domain-containing protein [Plenodomus tracheiphilus IPT5]|uniref:tRNA (uracil-O(2)-)-methyltransferase n=1 Tax=Plenodomus tracheiphilus IPT5 TaxID=1408161 RepID=A0A6A7B6Z6_9PLEO|nr:DUF1613-domain-containing protein [Plenodomus tracheiphilus IPT5]
MNHDVQEEENHVDVKIWGNFTDKKTPRPKKPIHTPSTVDVPGHKFQPYDLYNAPSIPSDLPPELWAIVQSCPANFTPDFFLDTSRSLLENPNLTASHLSRAELSYQSFADATFNPKADTSEDLASIVKHLRPECRPQLIEGGVPGYDLEWTVVRKLIPRNPNLDGTLMQTCHLYVSHRDINISNPLDTGITHTETVKAERYMVLYIPHATHPDQIPYYHPKVCALAMLYTYLPNYSPSPSSTLQAPGVLSIHYSLFPTHPLDTRLSRTALKLLEIIHKHSRGNSGGYKKRVYHDQIIPQKAFQDTYAELKRKYARGLIEGWVEQTPAEKHVFEDLGIAAFLIEVWVGMYSAPGVPEDLQKSSEGEGKDVGGEIQDQDQDQEPESRTKRRNAAQANFPGFVDIGCGNGLLVYILNAEGWHGWGFDARRRKTWDTFPLQHTLKLEELLLVPEILVAGSKKEKEEKEGDSTPPLNNDAPPSHHNGIFPKGTFIISNHADELTPWTPLLAYVASSPFIAIPCCSHDFGGTRFRAPACDKYVVVDAATGPAKNKLPSAYASLVSWVSHLTEAVGYVVEKEHLRIPSTRNVAVLGRTRSGNGNGNGSEEGQSLEEKLDFARQLVEREMGDGTTIEQVWRMWMKSGGGLLKPSKGGH